MLEKNVFGVTLSVPYEEMFNELHDKRIAPFIGNAKTRQFLEEIVRLDILNYPDKVCIILGENIVLGQTDHDLVNQLNFEVFPYNNSIELAAALHGVLVAQSRVQIDSPAGIKIYTQLNKIKKVEALKTFMNLPMIEGSLNEGLFRENIYKCPVIKQLLSNPERIRTVYFVTENALGDGSAMVEKSTYARPFIYESFIEPLNWRQAMLKYENLASQKPNTLIIHTPSAACHVDACASSRQEFVYDMTPEEKSELLKLCCCERINRTITIRLINE